jgi:acetyltransferase-like isoleucine patch superfamily enzyme
MLNTIRALLRRVCYCRGPIIAKLRNPRTRFGKNCTVAATAIFYRGGDIIFGDHCLIGHGVLLMPGTGDGVIQFGSESTIHPYSIIAGTGGVYIGNGVRIAGHAVIMSHNHNFDRVDIPIWQQGITCAPIHIEDDVWLGARVTVLPGVRIGTGAVIGAGAVVTEDIPARAIAVGIPARVVKYRGPQETPDGG